jgi:hypothetical protein
VRRPITACVALVGLLALSVASCSKLDRSMAPAEPPATRVVEEARPENGPTGAKRHDGAGDTQNDRWRQGENRAPEPVVAAAPATPPPPPPAEDDKPAAHGGRLAEGLKLDQRARDLDDGEGADKEHDEVEQIAEKKAAKSEVFAQPERPASGEPVEDVKDLLGALDGKAKPKVLGAAETPTETRTQTAIPDAKPEPAPEAFLPRMFYFENTYLGGNAAFTRRLLALDARWPGGDRPYARAAGPRQPFDAPPASGLGLTVNLDRGAYAGPGRVYLQIGLQGSPRYGWRRPPLDLVLVVDAAVLTQGREAVDALAREALRRLEPTDRLAIVLAGDSPRLLLDLAAPRDLRTALARTLDALPAQAEPGTPGALGTAIRAAGERLRAGAGSEARIPGAQEVLVLARAADTDRVAPAAAAAHEIGLAGVITSVVRFDAPGEAGLPFWDIAQAGQGNLRALPFGAPAAPMITAELADLSRVVARLIRVNVRLGAHTSAVRVLGSRMLDRDEVVRVKAREVAVDRNLSKTLGVRADRGEDDDGIQTVIPYFYGGDTHVMALELWVDGPGPVADVSLKYKDMVNLGNATARAGVSLSATPRAPTGAEAMVRRNIEAFQNAERLAQAAARVEAGDTAGATELLSEIERRSGSEVARALGATLRGGSGGDSTLQSEALRLAAARTVGVFEPAP